MIVLALLACDNPCRPGPDPTLLLGHGVTAFTPIDGPVPLVFGSQGGYHVDLAVEATHLDGRNLSAGILEGRLDGALVADGRPWFQLTCEDDVQVATGLRLILDEDAWGTGPETLVGQTLAITMELTDARATTVTASTDLVVGDLP